MAYPYGSYNEDTLKVLSKKNCAVGVTTEFGLADLKPLMDLRFLAFTPMIFLNKFE